MQNIKSEDCHITRLDHLGLISGMCKELGLIEYIDQNLPEKRKDMKLSHGELVLGMIINGLGYTSQPLHMYPEFMKDLPLDKLIKPNVSPEEFNQHALGRTLDKLFESDVSSLFTGFALKVIDKLNIDVKGLNIDATSFHFDGNCYNQNDETQVVQIKKGYSRDHRPDLNQVLLNLIVENTSGIPIYLQASHGNSADKSNFSEIVNAQISSLKAALNNKYLVGDSALYTADSLYGINSNKGFFITRAPSTLNVVKELICNSDKNKMLNIGEGYSAKEDEVTLYDIKQRFVVIFSEKAFNKECKTFHKKLERLTEVEYKNFNQFQKTPYCCEKDATLAFEKFKKQCKYLDFTQFNIISKPVYKKRGKPSKDAKPDSYNYFVKAVSYTCLQKYNIEKKQKGFFVLATNNLDKIDLSILELLNIYKSQQKVERGFRFLKSPEFLTSAFYLKKPERIEALLMIMTLCLLIYAALEHKIRTQLILLSLFFPDQKNQFTANPTARWVFFCFRGISILVIKKEHSLVTNLTERHKIILDCLGPEYWKIYS